MKGKISRISAMLLALLVLLSAFTACGGGNEGKDTTAATDPVTDATTAPPPPETLPPEEVLELPEDLTFDGEKYYILSTGAKPYDDFGYTADDLTVLGQAQYLRKARIEEKYDVFIEIETQVGSGVTNPGPGFNLFTEAAQANDDSYSIGLISGYDASNLTNSNRLYDLNSIEHIDTSKVWWDQDANNDLTVNGMLFYTNGRFTTAYSESSFIMYYNKALAAEAELEDIYSIVKEGKWTIDLLAEYSRKISEDLDGNDIMNENDRYGLYVWDDSLLGMLAASGTKCCTVTDGEMSLTLYNENTLNMFNKFTDIAYDKEYSLTYQRYEGLNVRQNFKENKAMFWSTFSYYQAELRDMENDFGILPYPKLDETQDRYYSSIAPYYSQFICVPMITNKETLSFIGCITEALAYEGRETVWPALYEQSLKGAFSRDDGTGDMLDIVYSSYGYDIGYFFKVGGYNENIMNLLRGYSKSFDGMYSSYSKKAERDVTRINKNFDTIIDWWNNQE